MIQTVQNRFSAPQRVSKINSGPNFGFNFELIGRPKMSELTELLGKQKTDSDLTSKGDMSIKKTPDWDIELTEHNFNKNCQLTETLVTIYNFFTGKITKFIKVKHNPETNEVKQTTTFTYNSVSGKKTGKIVE